MTEKAPKLTRDEMEQKYGDDSTEYPPEITELQKELSEQLSVHNKWCEENGLDPKDNEFYLDALTYNNDQGEPRHSGIRHVAGTYKGKKIFIYPGTNQHVDSNYKYAWKLEVPVIDIEGEERLSGKVAVHEKAKEIFDKLAPYVAYDKLKIVRANDEIRHHDRYIKGQPAREAAEKARAERKERQEQGRRAALEVLGIDPTLPVEEIKKKLEEMTNAIKAIEIPEPYTHSGHEHHRIGKAEAIIKTLSERRGALLAVMGATSENTPLTVSGKVFKSTNTHRRASQNWSIVGPREWDEWTVTQKMIKAEGEVNGKQVSLEATKTYMTTESVNETPLYSYDDRESAATVAEELASYNRLRISMKLVIGSGDGLKELEPYWKNFDGWDPVREESDAIFQVLFHLVDYTEALTKRVERLKVEEARAQAKQKENAERAEAEKTKEAEAIKKIGDLF